MEHIRLRVIEPGRRLRRVSIALPALIGRSDEADVVVADPTTSWKHCLLFWNGAAVCVEDLGSKNGTTVDGVRLEAHEPFALATGAVIRVGIAEIVLVAIGADPRVDDRQFLGDDRVESGHRTGRGRPGRGSGSRDGSRPIGRPFDFDDDSDLGQTMHSGSAASGGGRSRAPTPDGAADSEADEADAGESAGSADETDDSALPGSGASPPPSRAQPSDVLLGASAPPTVRPGQEYTLRFVASLRADAQRIVDELRRLSPRSKTQLSPLAKCWSPGTEVTVVARCSEVVIEAPARQTFTWTGDPVVLDFDVSVPESAAERDVVQKLDVFIAGIRVATLRSELGIRRDAVPADPVSVRAHPAHTAFASYDSDDRARVLDRVAAVSLAAGLDVFLDCITLRANDRYEDVIRNEIIKRDLFLLFWSRHAKDSKWVTKELDTALDHKGEECVQVHPLEPFDASLVPERLKHVHLGDVLMTVRDALLDDDGR